MSSSLAAALEALESAPQNLTAFRRVAHRVSGVRDLDVLSRAIEARTKAEPDQAWRLWLGFGARAEELGSDTHRVQGLRAAVASAPSDANALRTLEAQLGHDRGPHAACLERLATLASIAPEEQAAWTERALDAYSAEHDLAGGLRMAVRLAGFGAEAASRAFAWASERARAGGWSDEIAAGTEAVVQHHPALQSAFQRLRWELGERDAASLRAEVEAAPEDAQVPLLRSVVDETPDLRSTIARLAQSVWRNAREPSYLQLAVDALDASGQPAAATAFLAAEAEHLPSLAPWVERWSAAAAAMDSGPERDALYRLIARAGAEGTGVDSPALVGWLALAGSPTVAIEEREAALREATEATLSLATDDALHELLDALLANPLPDAAGWICEWLDRLADARATDVAHRLAMRTLAAWENAGPDLWDRAAQLALAVDAPEAAADALSRWVDADAPIPNDRLVQWIRLTEDGQRAEAAAIRVLRTEPERADVRDALARHGTSSYAAVGRALLQDDESDVRTVPHQLAAAAMLTAGDADAEALTAWIEILRDPHDAALVQRAEATFADDPRALLALAEARLSALAPVDQVALLYRMADWEDDDDKREARWLAVLEADLSEIPARRHLIARYAATGCIDEQAALLEEVATFAATADERFDAWVQVADARASQDGQGDAVRQALEQALRVRPGDPATLARLERAYAEAGDAASIASLMVRRADAETDVDRKIETLRAAARTLENDAGALDEALVLLERVLALEPANLPVLEDKARLEAALERWDEVLRTLDHMAQHAPVEELRADILVRGFRVLHHRLNRSADAAALMAAALQTIDVTEQDREAFRVAAESGDAWNHWVVGTHAWWSRQADAARTTEAAHAALVDLAEVMHRRLAQSGDALALLVASLMTNPQRDARLSLAEEIAQHAGLRTHLVDVYRALMDAHPEQPEVLAHGIEATAEIALGLSRPAVAFDIHMRGLEHDALREQTRATLRDLAEKHGLWDRYRDVLRDDEGGQSVHALLERARVEREHLEDWRSALATLVSAFEQSPFAPEVMEPLAALCDAHEAWPNLLQAYETLAASQPDWEVRLRLEMADISERMGEPTMAIAQHVMAWKRDSDDDSAWLALQARAERLGHLKDAAKAGTWKLTQNLDNEAMAKWSIRTQRAALRAELPDRASAALFAHSASSLPTADWFDEACEVWRESHPLDGFDWAMQTGEQVPEARLLAFDAAAALATTPIQMAMAAKARLDAAPTDEHRQAWIDALLAAERFVEARDAWVAWAAERTEPEGIRVALLAAHALDQQIGELPSVSADRLAEAALRDTADDALFDAWLESARAAERWPAVAAALIGRESKQDAPQTWLQASKVFEESLGDPGRALDAIRTGLDHLPDDRDLAARRAELLAVLERWAEHVAALEALAELAEASQAGQLLSQAAEAAELQLTDTRRALELLEAASRRDPDRSTPWLEQARLHASLGATDDSAACLREGIARLREEQSTSPNPRRLAAVLTQLAELSDDGEALPLLREARELDPTAPAPRIALFAALRRSGDTDGVLAVIDEALRDATPEDAAALLLERANVLLHDAKRPTDAARTLERVRAQVGDTPGVHAITGDFHLLAERWDDAFQAYRSALGASENLAPNEVPAPRATLPNERVDRSSVTAIYLGRAAVSAENAGLTREAQELFAAANLEDERDPVALLGLARLAVKRGAAEAARIYLADLEAGPDGEADDVRDAIDALKQRAGL